MAVVIADAGPIIAFAKINQLNLLQQLFSNISITESVRSEVLASHSKDAVLIQSAIDEGWVQCVADPKLNTVASRSLGLGEKTAIEYALQSKDDVLLIMDDALARKKALHYQLKIVGTAMLIYTAERKQLITHADTLIEDLRQKGYRISSQVINSVKSQLAL